MAILIQVNGNNSGEGFLIAPDGARTFPVSVGLRLEAGDPPVTATLQASPAANVAGLVFSSASVALSTTEQLVDVHATAPSAARNDTVLQVLVGGVLQQSFNLTAIANPEVWFKGRFEARFATNPDPYNHPTGTPAGTAFSLPGEPDFVPADSVPTTITKPVGRVVRFNNSPVHRSHVDDIGVTVIAIKGGPGGPAEEFAVGDPIIGQPVDLGPNSYLAENDPPGSPAPAENYPAPSTSPIGLFEFHLANLFSGKSDPPSHRPTGSGAPTLSVAEKTQYGIGSVTAFNNTRRTLLQDEFDNLTAAEQAAQVGQNLTMRLSRLTDAAQFGWNRKATYTGQIDSEIDFQPSNSSVLSYLAGFSSFTFSAKFFNFHFDDLRGQVHGSVVADVALHATPLQTGIYDIDSRKKTPFAALTVVGMTTVAIDGILGGASTPGQAVVTVSSDLDRLVVSLATIADTSLAPEDWTISSRGETLVGEFLPEASVLPGDMLYRILQPGDSGTALGACEGTLMSPAPTVGFARLFADGPTWRLLLHAGTNGAGGVTYRGHWAGSTATVATGCVPIDVELLTPTINFGDVEEGLTMNRQILVLNRSAGPVDLSLPSLSLPFIGVTTTATIQPGEVGILQVAFLAGAPGPTETVVVSLIAPGVTGTLDVTLSGTPVEVRTVDAVLVLDRSFSMTEPAINVAGHFMSKAQMRNEAAKVFIGMLREHDRIGIVRFNQDAQVHFPFEEAGPEIGGTGRANATAAIDFPDLNSAGSTSVGDGMFEANAMLTAPSTADRHALVVLTDGKENQDRRIADVTLNANVKAYAIGLGLPQEVDVAKLSAVTGNTGGYLLVTGTLGANQFRLHKYYAQILAGIHGNSVVLDPQGLIDQGEVHRIPFYISEADSNFDVVMFTRFPMLRFTIEAPDGTRIDPANVASFNGQFVSGQVYHYYRMQLPTFASDFDRALGKWHIVIEYRGMPKYRGAKAARIQKDARADLKRSGLSSVLDTGANYQVLVTARSNIRMDTRIEQRSFAPGLDRSVVAFLTGYGQPLASGVKLLAQVTRPDGVVSLLPMAHQGNGRFEAKLDDAKMLGHYDIVVRATGKTPRNFPLQREHTLSGVVLDPAADGTGDGRIDDITDVLKNQDAALKDLAKLFADLFAKLQGAPTSGSPGSDVLAKWLLWILIVLILILLAILLSLFWH
jgi:von Willebrand factor type A domain-containing protein